MGCWYRSIIVVLIAFSVGCATVSSGLGHVARTQHGTSPPPNPLTINLEADPEPVFDEEEENSEQQHEEENRRNEGVPDELIVATIVAGVILFGAGAVTLINEH